MPTPPEPSHSPLPDQRGTYESPRLEPWFTVAFSILPPATNSNYRTTYTNGAKLRCFRNSLCLFDPMFLNTGPSNHTAVFPTVPSPLASVNLFSVFIMALSQAIPTLLQAQGLSGGRDFTGLSPTERNGQPTHHAFTQSSQLLIPPRALYMMVLKYWQI